MQSEVRAAMNIPVVRVAHLECFVQLSAPLDTLQPCTVIGCGISCTHSRLGMILKVVHS